MGLYCFPFAGCCQSFSSSFEFHELPQFSQRMSTIYKEKKGAKYTLLLLHWLESCFFFVFSPDEMCIFKTHYGLVSSLLTL